MSLIFKEDKRRNIGSTFCSRIVPDTSERNSFVRIQNCPICKTLGVCQQVAISILRGQPRYIFS